MPPVEGALLKAWARQCDAMEKERRAYDYMLDILTGDAATRKTFVLNIKRFVEDEYALELGNPRSCAWAELHAGFFSRALADSTVEQRRIGVILQNSLVLWAVLHEAPIHAFFAPPLSSGDAAGFAVVASTAAAATDEACVDRAAFNVFLTKQVKRVFDDFAQGEAYTLDSMVMTCIVMYDALLPGDPVRRTGHPPLALPLERNKRRRA